MEKCATLLAFVILIFLLTPSMLQGNGSYGTSWIEDNTCSSLDYKPVCCKRNQTLQCNGSFGLEDLDYLAYWMNVGAFTILFSPFYCILTEVCCINNKGLTNLCTLIGGFCFLFYPLAGLLSFIGCMIIVGEYPGHTYGASFIQCLTAGLLVLIMTGILFIWAYVKNKNKREAVVGATVRTRVHSDDSPGALATHGGPQHTVSIQTTVARTTVIHSRKHGRLYLFMVRVNVIHVILH